MRSTLTRLARSAWKGPYFTAFPNLAEALQTNTAIRTSARACTILPNFVGSAFSLYSPLALSTSRVAPH
ncbi:hypothetical protein VP01_6854g1 [Puccinia sorghi]|uniref:Uncharacterized protein n=1 Tax=Puccinia sorghi TaxID=27349 RepID=A0A0L6UEC1_9BASI|nr:hypothetical protein VP01_6854g1 [Puccinia sorghi]